MIRRLALQVVVTVGVAAASVALSVAVALGDVLLVNGGTCLVNLLPCDLSLEDATWRCGQ